MQEYRIAISALYQIGESVYLVNDPDQYEWIVVGYYIRENEVRYVISFMGDEIVSSGVELQNTKNELKSLLQ